MPNRGKILENRGKGHAEPYFFRSEARLGDLKGTFGGNQRKLSKTMFTTYPPYPVPHVSKQHKCSMPLYSHQNSNSIQPSCLNAPLHVQNKRLPATKKQLVRTNAHQLDASPSSKEASSASVSNAITIRRPPWVPGVETQPSIANQIVIQIAGQQVKHQSNILLQLQIFD